MKTAFLRPVYLIVLLTFWVSTPAQDTIPKKDEAAQTPQTVAHLKSKIAMVLADPSIRRGRVGVKIVSSKTGSTIYERDAQEYFMPASNMKSFTVAAAIEELSPSFRFKTSVYSTGKLNSDGTLIGDMIVYGRGDPTFSESFYSGSPYQRFDQLADSIVAAGVKTISGSIVGDETYFNTNPIPFGWEWDDLQWYYGAEISSLTVFDNTLELKVLPSEVGSQCVTQVSPVSRFVKIVNKTTTTSDGEPRKLRVTKLLGQNVIEIAGNMPANDRGFTGRVAISRPAEIFAEILAQRLIDKGVKIKGGIRAVNLEENNGIRSSTDELTEIAVSLSPPLSLIAPKTMKPSQNLYTELLLRAVGEASDKKGETVTSDKKGIDAVQDLLRRAGAEPRSIIQYDGSGLSRHNLITPDSAVKLFLYMNKSRNALVWRNSLTIGGIDGTLRNRFKGTSAEGNVRGKTGTLDQVSALSGYITSKSGEEFVFSVLTNNIPNSRLRTSTIDSIVVLLSDFDGTLEVVQ